jgi:hypothetical protein
MTPGEFEQKKRALEEQLRSGIEMLQRSFQIQLRALELVRWSEGPAGDLPDGSPEREPLRRRSEWSEPGVLLSRVEEALGQLPDEVTKNDVIRVLGFTPERSSLHRAITKLERRGILALQTRGDGRLPSVYRKLPPKGTGGP